MCQMFLKKVFAGSTAVTHSNKCVAKKSLEQIITTHETKTEILDSDNVTNELSNQFPSVKLDDDENYNHFIHEPEELSVLFDSRLLQIIQSPIFDNKMASPSNTTQLINDKVFKEEKLLVTNLNELGNDDIKRKQSLQILDELESDLSKNKYFTDADVLKAVCVYSESPVAVNNATLELKEVTSPVNCLEKVCNIVQTELYPDNNSVNSLEYWSDEEGRYPPQMSLSPMPGEPTFRKTTLKNKEIKRCDEIEHTRNMNINVDEIKNPLKSNNLPRTHLKRPLVRALSPINSKYPPYRSHKNQPTPNTTESTPQSGTPSFLINSTESVVKSMTSSQLYNRKPKPQNDWSVISSPSLIRPVISTPPRTRKHKQSSATTEIITLNYSNRMRGDKLFDAQRCSMPKRKVSRSQSSNATSTKFFPEISSIAKTQATSKSIADFRQSSSIFGKLVKKNNVKESPNDKNKDKLSKATDSTSTSSSPRSKVGETTRRKLRRILSLH